MSVEDVNLDDPMAGFAVVDEELARFDPELAKRPQIASSTRSTCCPPTPSPVSPAPSPRTPSPSPPWTIPASTSSWPPSAACPPRQRITGGLPPRTPPGGNHSPRTPRFRASAAPGSAKALPGAALARELVKYGGNHVLRRGRQDHEPPHDTGAGAESPAGGAGAAPPGVQRLRA
jgi:hypothetical protein